MRLVFTRILSPFVLIALITFTSASVLHEIIPHEHSSNSPFAQAVWQNIHATLAHEGKESPIAHPALITEESTFFAVSRHERISVAYIFFRPLEQLEILLHRGVLAYRKFG